MINRKTIKILELFESNVALDVKKTYGSGQLSLYSILNKCNTRSGKKRLKALICGPLIDAENIKQRQETIQEIIKKEELMLGLEKVFNEYKIDIEKTLGFLSRLNFGRESPSVSEQIIRTTLELFDLLKFISKFGFAVQSGETEFFKGFKQFISNKGFSNILEKMRELISEESTMMIAGQRSAIHF